MGYKNAYGLGPTGSTIFGDEVKQNDPNFKRSSNRPE
jgi:hypothetical protein